MGSDQLIKVFKAGWPYLGWGTGCLGLEMGNITPAERVCEVIILSGNVDNRYLYGMGLNCETPDPDQLHESGNGGVKFIQEVAGDHVIYMEYNFVTSN